MMMIFINRMSCSLLLLTLVIVATYCRAESIAIDGSEQQSHSLLRQQKQTDTLDYTGEYYCN